MVGKTLKVNGTGIHYETYGDGSPLILLHGGMGFDSSYFKVPGILDLATQGTQIILFDQRGHGQSQICSPSNYTHTTWLEDLEELACELNLQKYSLLGHSYGGYLALELAVRNPPELDKLILISTAPGPIDSRDVPHHPSDARLKEDVRGKWPSFFYRGNKYWEIFNKINFRHEPFNAAFHRELKKYDVRNKLERIQAKTLIVVGGEDEHFLSASKQLATGIPQSRLVIIPGAGHFPFIERPEEFHQAVSKFLVPKRQRTPKLPTESRKPRAQMLN